MKKESFTEVEPALTPQAYYDMNYPPEPVTDDVIDTVPAHMQTAPQPKDEPVWRMLAECNNYDTRVFFPTDGVGVEVAKKICAECVVRQDCLEEALSRREDHGVWGGTSERERRKILKKRAKSQAGS